MHDDPKLHNFGTVTDANGEHRLSLFYITRGDRGFDFHSLVWEQKTNGIWKTRVEIAQSVFEADCENRRWVSKLHSLDSARGCAILQIAEGDAPKSSRLICYRYSWRKWNLNQNREVEFLQKCMNPAQPYDPSTKDG
jgi:hypothetical protein